MPELYNLGLARRIPDRLALLAVRDDSCVSRNALTGGLFEQIIPQTVEALHEIGVGLLVPSHCTGWRATHMLAAAMPEAFVQPSVGTVYRVAAGTLQGP